MRRFSNTFECLFNIGYLLTAFTLGLVFLFSFDNKLSTLAGIMALILAGGDSFHLVPRIKLARASSKEDLTRALGRGKQITSISMTIFYLFLWEIGQLSLINSPSFNKRPNILDYLVYFLAIIRIILCLSKNNRWTSQKGSYSWGIYRNIPFLMMGIIISIFFYNNFSNMAYLNLIWLAIILSFLFYMPVVLWVHKAPIVGMLMLPKSSSYIWILVLILKSLR